MRINSPVRAWLKENSKETQNLAEGKAGSVESNGSCLWVLMAGTAAWGTLAPESGRSAERRCQQISGQGKISRTNNKEDQVPCSVYKTRKNS